MRPGFVLVGGRTIAEHQLDVALDFGCERIVCLVTAIDPQLLGLQHRAERAGRSFHTVTAPRELSALVTANDEVVMLAEGLLADRERALNVLETGTGVFVQPVETGVAAGFERLDINNASAGILRLPGRLIEGLTRVSEDYDVGSALTRIALQDGIPMREVPAEARCGLHWLMISSEADAYAIEHDWLEQQLGQSPSRSPGNWLARQGVLSFGPSLLHGGNASAIMLGAMLAALALAVGIASLGWPVTGFAGCAVAWIFYRIALLLRRVEQPAFRRDGPRHDYVRALGWLFDALLVLLAAWSVEEYKGGSFAEHLFSPIMFVLLVRLLPQLHTMLAGAWLSDRAVLSVGFAIFAALGVLHWALALGAVFLAGLAIFATRPNSG
ncbi:MAG: hypothetical protein EOP02_24900 [Proteobacteria bacterium]|nr:MAG: hypothetical protein EOP02_24900 [Pseudomonadota bacterium]